MKKSMSIISISVLAASLAIPMGRAYADLNPPGNARQRQELREDLQRLERLRQQRAREVRQREHHGEGDRAMRQHPRIEPPAGDEHQDRAGRHAEHRDRHGEK